MVPSAKEPMKKKVRRPVKDKMEPMKVKKSKGSAAKATSARRKSKNHLPSTEIDPIPETRDTKSREPAQTKLKRSKVTKVGSVNGSFGGFKLKSNAKRSSKIDNEPTEPLAGFKEAALPACSESQDFRPNDAIRRRNNWTPVQDTGNDFMIINHEEANTQAPLDQDTPAASKRMDRFDKLVGTFGYAPTSASHEESPRALRNPTGEALTKRRKVEV